MLIEEPKQGDNMGWKDIIKQEEDAAGSDVMEETISFDAQDARAGAGRMATGQYKEIADQVANLAIQARTQTQDQKRLLGQIRLIIKQANIPEVAL